MPRQRTLMPGLAVVVLIASIGFVKSWSSTIASVFPQSIGITAVSPHEGSHSGGTPVAITGSGFSGASTVHFGAALATNVTIVSDSEIHATTPVGAPGATVDVVVSNATATSAYSVTDQFTYDFGVTPDYALFAEPYAGDFPTGNFMDHEFVGEFNDSNDFQVTSWGARTRGIGGHGGYDWGLPIGTPLLAVANGTTIKAETTAPFYCPLLRMDVQTMHVILQFTVGSLTLTAEYEHMSRIDVTQGQHVTQGQQIGLSGNSGCSSGPHLHFEVHRNPPGAVIDPYGWQGTSNDPWAQHPQGAPSLWLWQPNHAPALYSQSSKSVRHGANNVTITTLRSLGYQDDANPNNEFIELSADPNQTVTQAIDLTGWSLANGRGEFYHLPAGYMLKPGNPVRIFSGQGSNIATALYWNRTSPAWMDIGDCAFLYKPNGQQMDMLSYGGDSNCGGMPQGVATTNVPNRGPRVYVSALGSDSVAVIDPSANKVIDTVALPPNAFPEEMAALPNGTYVYVTENGGHDVAVIDTASNTVVQTISTATGPWGIAINPSGTRAYVTNLNDNSVTVIDTSSKSVVGLVHLPAGSYPMGIALNATATRAFVVTTGTDTLTTLDITTDTPTIANTFAIPSSTPQYAHPAGIAINAASTRAFVSGAHNSSYYEINISAAMPTLVGQHALGKGGVNPTGIVLRPDDKEIYIANGGLGNISVFDTLNDTSVMTVSVGARPRGLAFLPNGSALYVANDGDGTVSVINPATNTVVTTIPITLVVPVLPPTPTPTSSPATTTATATSARTATPSSTAASEKTATPTATSGVPVAERVYLPLVTR